MAVKTAKKLAKKTVQKAPAGLTQVPDVEAEVAEQIKQLKRVQDFFTYRKKFAKLQNALSGIDFVGKPGDVDAAMAQLKKAEKALAEITGTKSATAKAGKGEVQAKIVEYLEAHPASTATVIKDALGKKNLANTLGGMVKQGTIKKVDKRYSVA